MKSLSQIKNDKRGIFGLTAIQQFFIVILGVALLAYVIVVIMGTLTGTTILSSVTGAVTNGTTSSAPGVTGVYLKDSNGVALNNFIGSSCTITTVINATNNNGIVSGNYTQPSPCLIAWNSSVSDAGGNNASLWNVTYSYTHNSNAQNQENAILGNTSTGVTSFFSSINSVYAILAVLVIILVLVVLVRVVSAPGQSSESGFAL